MFNILITFRDIEYLGKINYGDICQFIRDTSMFTYRDMGYLVPPYTSLISVLRVAGLKILGRVGTHIFFLEKI